VSTPPGTRCAKIPCWLILSYPPTLSIPWIVTTLLQSDPSSVHQESGSPPAMPVWQLVVLSGITLWLYRSILTRLVGQWWHDPNFSHGFFVPLFSALVIWQERARLGRLPLNPSWFGLPIAAVAMCVLIVGQLGAELFLSRSSLLVLLAGLIVLFCGWIYFRALMFPWAFLILMIPIPTVIFNQITFPLQLLASRVSSLILPMLGVPVLREGNVINLPAMALEVAEACSGIRSLMSLVALAIMYGYLMEKRQWVRWILAFASVPIAVAANSVRIIGTGLLVQYWDPEKAEGYFHASWGWIIFVISLVMLYALHGLITVSLQKAGAKE
jgi:exosortase